MNQAKGDGFVPEWLDGSADHITVELHSSSTYSGIELSIPDVALITTGTATVIIPATYSSSYYY